jgi:hypothetical protein
MKSDQVDLPKGAAAEARRKKKKKRSSLKRNKKTAKVEEPATVIEAQPTKEKEKKEDLNPKK